MGFLARAVGERKAVSLDRLWDDMVLSFRSKSGQTVTLDSAFRVSAALACMREISQGLAQVPFKLLLDYEDGGLTRKRPAREHAVYDLVTAKPNGWQTSFEFMEQLGLHASMGNAYAYKNIVRGSRVKEVFLLDPGRVEPQQGDDMQITYKVTGMDGTTKTLDQSEVWHVRGPSWDGVLGMDILRLAREAMGLSLALESSVASLHANGVRPTGIYSVEGTLGKPQYEQLSEWLKKQVAAGVGTPLILDRNAKWLQQTMTSIDAQTKEMRDQQTEEICRFFGVLPTIIGYTGDKANTYASAEVMENAHKVRTLGRWYKRIQDSADVNLLTDDERRKGYYFKFIANALMAASAKDRGEFYARALGSGGSPAFMTQDEVRGLEDLDPMGGDAAVLPPTPNKPAPAGTAANP